MSMLQIISSKGILRISWTLISALCGLSVGHSQQQCVKHLTPKRVITKQYFFCSYLALLYTRINRDSLINRPKFT